MLLSPAEDRDVIVMAAVFSVAAMAWLGWAQEGPPQGWALWLGIGSGTCVLAAAAAGLLAWRHWDEPTVLGGPHEGIVFGIIVGIEVLVAAGGAAALALAGHGGWTSVWVCAVVGAHFVPLGTFFHDRGLWVLAGLLVAAAGAALLWARQTSVLPSAATGLLAGACFAVFAARSFVTIATR